MKSDIRKEFKKAFPQRSLDSHKGDYGKIFILSGSTGMTGAATLSCMAALRSGAGLVTLGIPESLNSVMEVKLTEAMTYPIEDGGAGFLGGGLTKGKVTASLNKTLGFAENKDAIGLGPGLSRNPQTLDFVRCFFRKNAKPLVLDADGLMAFQGHLKLLETKKKSVVITPHPGEFDILFNSNTRKIKAERQKHALSAAKKYGIVVVLKGHHTVVASPRGKVFINKTGNPGMATGGTGDCLLGILTAFLGFGMEAFEAAKLAVFIHGVSGDLARDVMGESSLIASDLIDFLPETFYQLKK